MVVQEGRRRRRRSAKAWRRGREAREPSPGLSQGERGREEEGRAAGEGERWLILGVTGGLVEYDRGMALRQRKRPPIAKDRSSLPWVIVGCGCAAVSLYFLGVSVGNGAGEYMAASIAVAFGFGCCLHAVRDRRVYDPWFGWYGLLVTGCLVLLLLVGFAGTLLRFQ